MQMPLSTAFGTERRALGAAITVTVTTTIISKQCCLQAGVGRDQERSWGRPSLLSLPKEAPHRTSEPRSTCEAPNRLGETQTTPPQAPASPPPALQKPRLGAQAPPRHQEEKGAPLPQLLSLSASRGPRRVWSRSERPPGAGASFSCFRVAPVSSFYHGRILNSSWGNRCRATVSEAGRKGGHRPARGERKFRFR